jgi:hypothetical protein
MSLRERLIAIIDRPLRGLYGYSQTAFKQTKRRRTEKKEGATPREERGERVLPRGDLLSQAAIVWSNV